MPIFATTPRFRRDYARLTVAQQRRIRRVVLVEFVPDAGPPGSGRGRAVNGVQGAGGT